MTHDTHPTDRARTDAVLDWAINLAVENAALTVRCAQLMDDANAACDERDEALRSLATIRHHQEKP